MKCSFLLLLAACTMLLTSCFSTYQVESAQKTAGKQSRLIIYREGIMGLAVGTVIHADGQFVGKVGVNRYISCWLPEGEHLLSVRTNKTDEVFFKVNMKAGNTYAYSFRFSVRDNGRPHIDKMEDLAVLDRRRQPIVNYYE